MSNKEIAFDLKLTPGTVRGYVSGLYRALGVRSRWELIAALRCRYFCPERSPREE